MVLGGHQGGAHAFALGKLEAGGNKVETAGHLPLSLIGGFVVTCCRRVCFLAWSWLLLLFVVYCLCAVVGLPFVLASFLLSVV